MTSVTPLHSFMHSFSKYFLDICVPHGIILVARDIVGNKTEQPLLSWDFIINLLSQKLNKCDEMLMRNPECF